MEIVWTGSEKFEIFIERSGEKIFRFLKINGGCILRIFRSHSAEKCKRGDLLISRLPSVLLMVTLESKAPLFYIFRHYETERFITARAKLCDCVGVSAICTVFSLLLHQTFFGKR